MSNWLDTPLKKIEFKSNSKILGAHEARQFLLSLPKTIVKASEDAVQEIANTAASQERSLIESRFGELQALQTEETQNPALLGLVDQLPDYIDSIAARKDKMSVFTDFHIGFRRGATSSKGIGLDDVARKLEYGTSGTPKVPHIRPTFQNIKNNLPAEIALIQKRIKSAVEPSLTALRRKLNTFTNRYRRR